MQNSKYFLFLIFICYSLVSFGATSSKSIFICKVFGFDKKMASLSCSATKKYLLHTPREWLSDSKQLKSGDIVTLHLDARQKEAWLSVHNKIGVIK